MEKVAFYDARPYDKVWFDRLAPKFGVELRYLENRLRRDTAVLASGCRAAVIFVNDSLDGDTAALLREQGVEVVALRCAGFNNVDLKGAEEQQVRLYRVPGYSPAAVAEHAMALLLSLNRRIHKAYNRTREFNFSLNGLVGKDLKGKTVGIVGTGKVGRAFADICRGFGMNVIAHDPEPVWGSGIEYVDFAQLCIRSDVISVHCPLTRSTHHMFGRQAFTMMKQGVYIINTSRGALIDSAALLDAIKCGKVGGAGLDVYEEETDLFYEDVSSSVVRDDILNMLVTQPNVIVTSHQAFLTEEALGAIAETTLRNLRDYFDGRPSRNELHAAAEAIV